MTPSFKTEIENGQGQKLTTICQLIPSYREGRPATLSRVLRWILNGRKAPDGTRVRLEAMKTPGGWISTPAALTRFFIALTPNLHNEQKNETVNPSKNARNKASEQAAKILETHGI